MAQNVTPEPEEKRPSNSQAAEKRAITPERRGSPGQSSMGRREPTYPDVGGQIQPVKQTKAERDISRQ